MSFDPGSPAPVSFSPQAAAPTRSWWSRNWGWVVGLGCLLPVVVCGGGLLLLIGSVLGFVRTTEPYQAAMKVARADARVEMALGSPVKEGWFTSANFEYTNGNETTGMSIPVSGPKASGTLVVKTKRVGNGPIQYETLRLMVPDQPGGIDLRPDQPADKPKDDGPSTVAP